MKNECLNSSVLAEFKLLSLLAVRISYFKVAIFFDT